VREYCRLQWALTLGLAPLVIAYFGQVSLVSFFVNLAAIPLFSLLVVPLSLGAAALAMIGGGNNVVVAIAGEVARVVWHGLATAAESPMAAFEVAPPKTGTLWLALGAVVAMIVRPSVPGRWLVAFALLPLVAPRGSAPGPGEARVTVLDVGHGLAVAVETASHRALYDAGPLTRSGFDAGAEIVGPALAALAREPLDLLVISHADSDHAGGADAVRARYPGARVLAGPDFEAGADDVCETGQEWVWDRVRFEVLHPRDGFFPEGNETSCVLRIETASGVLLLTGDIEHRAEAALAAAAGPDLEADVVVVPHHGSATSSTPAFVARVAPRIAIVSSAHNNRWGFPRDEVRQRWESAGASLLVTADSGAIDLRFENGEIRFEAARSARRRYWQAQAAVVSGAIVASAL
jgi:competence protein ComEC